MTRVLLVRHGQSEWNQSGRWQGQADVDLSALGRAQAAEAARSLGAVDAIVASDLARAAGTAHIIADALGIGPVVVDPDLRERHAGEWQGLTRADIHRDWPGYLADDPRPGAADGSQVVERRPPGWEPDESLVERAMQAIARMARAVPDGDVLAVSHGGLIMAVEQHLGDPAGRLANLDARWVTAEGTTCRLGARVRLVDPDAITLTTPDAI